MNQRRMKRMPRSWTSALTSSWVCGRSSCGTGRETSPRALTARWTGGRGVSPTSGRAQRLSSPSAGSSSRPRSVSSYSTLTGLVAGDVALDDAGRLELLHALGQQPVGQLGDRVADLAEAQRAAALEQHVEDRARPALADQLDGAVEVGTAARAPAVARASRLRSCDVSPRASSAHAAFSTRVSSTEPSTGISPATFTIAVKHSRPSTAMASSSCSSVQPASFASSLRCWGQRPRWVTSGLRKRRSAASRGSRDSHSRASPTSSMPRPAWRAVRLWMAMPGRRAVVLGDRERDPLERRQLERAVAQLAAEARVAAQRGGRAGEHAEEVRELAGGGQRALEDGERALGRGELVVDGEAAHLGLVGHGDPRMGDPGRRKARWSSLRYVSVGG